MKLYYAPGACSLSPHIVARELGINVELKKVNTKDKSMEGGGDFWSVNAKGYVPTLELDNGQRLTEGPAIVQYLADQKPESGLAPKNGTFERYQVQEWLNFLTSEVHKQFSPLFRPNTPEEYKPIAKENIGKRFDLIDKHLAGKDLPDGQAVHRRRRVPLRPQHLDQADADRPREVAQPAGVQQARRRRGRKVKEAMQAEGLLPKEQPST
jgi:glutathione S-transferase